MEDVASLNETLRVLHSQCTEAEQHLKTLRYQIAQAERQLRDLRYETSQSEATLNRSPGPQVVENEYRDGESSKFSRFPLAIQDYPRYGRQLILPEIGAAGQYALKNARLLIVGVGGLGCPAAAYLAGAGVGSIGLIDGDTVDVSNLHRQIAHSTDRVGMKKVDSAYRYLSGLNPTIKYECHTEHLTPQQALTLFEQYDLILDCTDNPTTRYMISDACVIAGRPLISASALKTEGQLIVLNNPPHSGAPCYRCIFPKPPPADAVLTCGEGGILGPVVGVMGVLQALEAIKVLTARTPASQDDDNSSSTNNNTGASMLLFSAYGAPQFRTIKMRPRNAACATCGKDASITRRALQDGLVDYQAFCGIRSSINDVPADRQISATDLNMIAHDPATAIIDVRDETQFQICSLKGSINIPWTGDGEAWGTRLLDLLNDRNLPTIDESSALYLICRHGNDSRLAFETAKIMTGLKVFNVNGGLGAWRKEVDPDFPEY